MLYQDAEKAEICLELSFPRKRESIILSDFWMPAFAGMTENEFFQHPAGNPAGKCRVNEFHFSGIAQFSPSLDAQAGFRPRTYLFAYSSAVSRYEGWFKPVGG